MAVVTSTQEQRRVAEAARRVGGYENLARLAQEKRQAPRDAKVTYDPEANRWTYLPKKA